MKPRLLAQGIAGLAAGLMMLLPIAGCSQTTAPQPTAQPVNLTILHTNDVRGYVEPCG